MPAPTATLTIRPAATADREPLAEPAALDSAPVPDPFERTAEVVSLLELRARHLTNSAWRPRLI
jgi:hypothetical protein